jgi:hypothetical protein
MRALYVSLFVVGVFSSILFGAWFVSGLLYAFDGTIQSPGVIAFVPKWIFLFSPLSLLWKKREVQETIELIVFLLERKKFSFETPVKEIDETCQRLNRIAIVDGDSKKIIFKKE